MKMRPARGTPSAFDDSAEAPDLGRSVELLYLAQDGDRDALSQLFERYRGRVTRIVRVRMGAALSRRLDPEDIVQDVFLSALGSIGSFRLESHSGIVRWLARIAENRIRDAAAFHGAQRRDARREVRLDRGTSSNGSAWGDPADGGPSPSQVIARAEFEELVDEHVRALEPEDYREVILLRDYYGADWATVREELGRPSVAACEELHRRALIKLRRSLRPWLRGTAG